MDTPGHSYSFSPNETAVSSAINYAARNNVNNATKVLVVNGDDEKQLIHIQKAGASSGTNSNGSFASFVVPRWQSFIVHKDATDTVFAQTRGTGIDGAYGDAINITFTKVDVK